MKNDMIDLIRRLEAISEWMESRGYDSSSRSVKEAIIRLIAMDAQIVKLQSKLGEQHGAH